jgi:hypothetical protein
MISQRERKIGCWKSPTITHQPLASYNQFIIRISQVVFTRFLMGGWLSAKGTIKDAISRIENR